MKKKELADLLSLVYSVCAVRCSLFLGVFGVYCSSWYLQ